MNDFGLLDGGFVEEVAHLFTSTMKIFRADSTGAQDERGGPITNEVVLYESISCLVGPLVADTPTGSSESRQQQATIFRRRRQALIPQYLSDVREGDFVVYEGATYKIEEPDSDSQNALTRFKLSVTTVEGLPLGE